MSFFDECFETSVSRFYVPGDFNAFWKTSIDSLRQIPLNLKVTRKKSKIFNKYTEYELEFDSVDKYTLTGKLFLPSRFNYNPPVVIRFPDYMEESVFLPELYENGIGQFLLDLRGHKEAREILANPEEKSKPTYGYFGENLETINEYYLKKLYLDAYRTLEALRLIKEIDKNKISIWGKGIGAAMGVFLQNYVDRITSLVLQQPGISYLDVSQNIARCKYAEEINNYIKRNKFSKKKIKENLAYFDIINFANQIQIPVVMLINLENRDSAPQGAFAFFHLIRDDKDMILYSITEEGGEGEDKLIVSDLLQFFRKTLK